FRERTMSRSLALPLLATALLLGGGCYQDDTSGPATHKPLAKVLLTDAPFPYDSVSSVNLHVVRIEASTQMDTSGGDWVVIAEPRQPFDLLQLQQGTTAILGRSHVWRGSAMTTQSPPEVSIWVLASIRTTCRLTLDTESYGKGASVSSTLASGSWVAGPLVSSW